MAAAALFLALAASPRAHAQANLPIDSFWVTNGQVQAVEESGGIVYLGGTFSYVGPPTGSVARLDPVTGAADLSFPEVDGAVLAVVPDGAGGVYIGGNFTSVGGLPRSSVAHILADGRVSSWNPNPPGGTWIYSLAFSGRVVYVGGSYASIGGQPRNNIAAVDSATGLATSWDPNANGTVRALVVSGSVVYAGGTFNSIGGQTRFNLTALDPGTGAATAWDPSANSSVYALALSGTTLYVGGNFTSVGGQSRNRIAAVSIVTGATTSWNPNAGGIVSTLLVSGNTVYVGGSFSTIGGQLRSRIAAIDATIDTNNATSWNPNADQTVRALSLVGTTLYAGGYFDNIGGQPRARLAALDTTVDTNNATSWRPGANDDVFDVLADPNRVYVGGNFSSAGGWVRQRLAALDAATGAATAWDPGADSGVADILASGTRVFVGGAFLNVGGQPRSRIAAIDASSGLAIPGWDPGADDAVLAFDLAGGVLYAGGVFGTMGGFSRLNLAALDEATGTVTAWSPSPTSTSQVAAVKAAGTSVYAGGWFDYGGRNHIVELDAATALPTGWNPNANGYVYTLADTPSLVYAGGSFSSIGGATRQRIAALDRAVLSNNATAWNPGAGSIVSALHLAAGTLYVGGSFVTIDGTIRTHIASFDEPTGNLTAWNPPLVNSSVKDIDVGSGKVFAGGLFTSINGKAREGFAAFCMADTPTGLTATPAGPNQIDLDWSPTSAPSYRVYRALDPAGPFALLGTTAATTYSDMTVHGGVTYHYVVRGVTQCESDPSTVASATATGSCTLPPDFEGVAWVEPSPSGTCSVELGWAPATDRCGGSVSYTVYRDTAPAFTPSAANLIATVPVATTYTDTSALAPGVTVYYIVRATSLPSGAEDPNLIRSAATPMSCSVGGTDTVTFLTVTSRDAENVLEWVTSTGFGNVRILYNEGTPCTFPTDPLGPADGVIDQGGAPGARAFYRHNSPALTNGMDYCYTIFSDKGAGTYSVGRSNRGRPMDPSLGVVWSFSTGTFSLTAPTVGWSGIIATSNDHVVHAMQRGVGGGEWPAAWLPIRLNGPVQSRSPIVPITVNTSNPVVYLGSQDGNVHVVDADLGGALPGYPRAPASLGGSPGQAAPAGIFTAFTGAHDYLLVGTRDTGADNRFFAFDPDLMTVINPPFNNGGGGSGIGIINGMATIEYPNARVYFTSYEKQPVGSTDTLWCLQLQTGPPPMTHLWSRPLGNIDSSPVLMGDRVYVGSPLPTGTLYSIDAATGTAPDRTFPHNDGQVKGFVFPDWRTGDLYFATDNYVWALHDDGASITNKFPGLPLLGGIDLGGGVVPTSAVVFVPGSHYVYVGGDDGKLYEIDVLAGPTPTIKSVQLGDGLATVGAPSLDWQNSLIHVGTEAGVFYAVPVPLP